MREISMVEMISRIEEKKERVEQRFSELLDMEVPARGSFFSLDVLLFSFSCSLVDIKMVTLVPFHVE